MSFIESLISNHPIRKNKKQKEAFRQWFIEQAASMDYTAQVEKKGSSHNVVIGDPERAKVIYTAHYDTPPVMPFPNMITPKNVGVYLLYQMGIVLAFLVICAGLSALTGWLLKDSALASLVAMVCYFGLLFLLMYGPANQNNVNDNTSGVAAVMEIMNRLSFEERSKAAFILFDNEEKGLLGSSAFASRHKAVKKNALLINLDCVGDGENMMFFANKKTRALPEYALLEETLKAQEGRNLLMEKMEKCIYPSDQANFKYGIAVCAANHKKSIGYYVDKIHTKKDTVCEQANMDYLGESLSRFVTKLDA